MSAKVIAEQQITVGQKAVVEGPSPDKKHVVVFGAVVDQSIVSANETKPRREQTFVCAQSQRVARLAEEASQVRDRSVAGILQVALR
jgi:hypothetical protein